MATYNVASLNTNNNNNNKNNNNNGNGNGNVKYKRKMKIKRHSSRQQNMLHIQVYKQQHQQDDNIKDE